ncbi:hypothetical protein BHE74_00007452 [Ensete ventricosum]|nr:hypothetical protein GW17_00003280 [Ensete ventricosum]RWW83992.1 hypothetical protein BHE74_00007452 [Ensete ventricosum]RZR85934.1 hypothetical protein BHM03_00013008 [Ensete ventricosum]
MPRKTSSLVTVARRCVSPVGRNARYGGLLFGFVRQPSASREPGGGSIANDGSHTRRWLFMEPITWG